MSKRPNITTKAQQKLRNNKNDKKYESDNDDDSSSQNQSIDDQKSENQSIPIGQSDNSDSLSQKNNIQILNKTKVKKQIKKQKLEEKIYSEDQQKLKISKNQIKQNGKSFEKQIKSQQSDLQLKQNESSEQQLKLNEDEDESLSSSESQIGEQDQQESISSLSSQISSVKNQNGKKEAKIKKQQDLIKNQKNLFRRRIEVSYTSTQDKINQQQKQLSNSTEKAMMQLPQLLKQLLIVTTGLKDSVDQVKNLISDRLPMTINSLTSPVILQKLQPLVKKQRNQVKIEPKVEKLQRNQKIQKAERYQKQERPQKQERIQKLQRFQKSQRSQRPERLQKIQRPERSQRQYKQQRQQKIQKLEKQQKVEAKRSQNLQKVNLVKAQTKIQSDRQKLNPDKKKFKRKRQQEGQRIIIG